MADGLLNKASIILTPTGYKAGTLYNVAPVVEPYEDFDFARASVASRVNSSGLVEMVGRTLSSELVTNGDFATDSDWNNNVGNDWQIVNGKLILTTTSYNNINQGIGLVQNKFYKIVFTIANTTLGGVRVRLGTGTITSEYTNGTHTIYLEQTTTNHAFRFYASSSGVFDGEIDNVSVKEVIDTNNIPRISYDSNGDNGHILLEPTSTNLITYSEDFSEWNKGVNTTTTPNFAISPDGTQNATRFQTPTGSGTYLTLAASMTIGNDYTLTLYLKNNGGENVDIGVAASSTVGTKTASIEVNLTNEWIRYELNFTADSNSNFVFIDNISNANSVDCLIWGAQLEALPYATSYIPTLTGSPETRATETATGAGSADLINSTEGVLYAEIAALVDDLSFRTISLSDGTTSNRCVLRYGGTTNRVNVLISSGGSIIFDNNFTLTEITNFNKIAVKWKLNDFALWVDGVERATDTSGAAPIGLSQLQLSNYNSSSNNFYGKCKALAVFNEALSDAELTQLTT